MTSMQPTDGHKGPNTSLFVWWIVGFVVSSVFGLVLLWLGGFIGAAVAFPIALLALALTAAMIVDGVVAGWRARSAPRRAASILIVRLVALVAAVFALVPINAGVENVMPWATLLVAHPGYERIVHQAEQNQLPPRDGPSIQQTADGTEFEAEHSPPGRIAFYFPNHFLSDREAIVYDPSIAGRPNGPNNNEVAYLPKGTFDGWITLKDCSHMTGKYYKCWLISPP